MSPFHTYHAQRLLSHLSTAKLYLTPMTLKLC